MKSFKNLNLSDMKIETKKSYTILQNFEINPKGAHNHGLSHNFILVSPKRSRASYLFNTF